LLHLEIGELRVRHAGGIADTAVGRCEKRTYLLGIGGVALSKGLERGRRRPQNWFDGLIGANNMTSRTHEHGQIMTLPDVVGGRLLRPCGAER